MIKEFLHNFWTNFPARLFFITLAIWAGMALVNFILFQNNFYTGVGILYPFSVIYPNALLPTGFLFATFFLLLGFYALKNIRNFNIFYLFLFCFCLIVAGNLAQGNADIAFMQPFYLKGRQYYTDAIQIENWQTWLRGFNNNLDTFQLHTRTHPPFTTLLHYFVLKLFNDSVMALGIVFFLFSFAGFFAFYKCLQLLEFGREQAKKVTLLFSIIPSVNIYALVSIDGIILSLSLFFLYGVLLIIKSKSLHAGGFILCLISFLLINSLSFSGLFFLAFLGILSLKYIRQKNFTIFWTTILLSLLSFILFYQIDLTSGYNHYLTFRHASHSENPNGFMLLAQPKVYFFTRLEDIGEILFFLSFALIAIVFSRGFFMSVTQTQKMMFYSAILALGLMFATGAYGTGETARACLFIVPYFVFLLKDVSTKTFSILFVLCLLQTFAMQMIGNFYW